MNFRLEILLNPDMEDQFYLNMIKNSHAVVE